MSSKYELRQRLSALFSPLLSVSSCLFLVLYICPERRQLALEAKIGCVGRDTNLQDFFPALSFSYFNEMAYGVAENFFVFSQPLGQNEICTDSHFSTSESTQELQLTTDLGNNSLVYW